MNRLRSLLIGPELYWLLVYAFSVVLAGDGAGGDPAVNLMLERACLLLPGGAVLLSFAVFFWLIPQASSRGWLVARLTLSALVGLNASLIALAGAIDYGDGRNAGVLGFWVYGIMVGCASWIAGIVVILLTGAGRRRE